MLKTIKKLSLLTCVMALALCFALPQNAQAASFEEEFFKTLGGQLPNLTLLCMSDEDPEEPIVACRDASFGELTPESQQLLQRRINDFEDRAESLSLAGQQRLLAGLVLQFNSIRAAIKESTQAPTQAPLAVDGIADAGTGFAAGSNLTTQNNWTIYLAPHMSSINNYEYNFHGGSSGLTAAFSYRVNDSFALGAHFDLGYSYFFGDTMDSQTKTLAFAYGLQAAYNFTPEWYLIGSITGITSSSDNSFTDTTFTTHYKDDSKYSSEALAIGLSTGYKWEVAKGHSLTPELGLLYLTTHTSDYDVEFSNAYKLGFDDTYFDALYGQIALDWRSQWDISNNSSFAFLAGVGLRQRLSANNAQSNLDITVGSATNSLSSQSKEDLTVFLLNAGLEYNIDIFTVGLNYDGSFGTQQTGHGGNLTLRLDF